MNGCSTGERRVPGIVQQLSLFDLPFSEKVVGGPEISSAPSSRRLHVIPRPTANQKTEE